MLTNIFMVIQFLMKLIGIWESFVVWSDKDRIAAAELREQKRAEALAELKAAQTEVEFDAAQDAVIRSRPRP